MRRVFLIPNAITALGLCCGLFVIFKIILKDSSRDLLSMLQGLSILLLIASVADVADGAVARMINAESAFGGQFDSLSDSVTFGIAPSIFVIKSLENECIHKGVVFFIIIAAMIYSLCGVLRLVRYNLSKMPKKIDPLQGKFFTGLPIPAAAAVLVSTSLILTRPIFAPLGIGKAFIMAAILSLMGFLMVSRWRFPRWNTFHVRVSVFYMVLATGLVAALLFYGIVDFFPEGFTAASWLYLLVLAPLGGVKARRMKKNYLSTPEEDELERIV
ncbi:Uncharacterized protein CLAVI_000054 [Candidatus Clavichlamydia salmonicola]|uniref:CDP-alcohol phosphatidyltransferase family protein n=1 Tax=Candidatus Clavichlamydia salmonicola TaxID=469812 RepID=UPI001891E54D|nr:phosphatidylcholine/phosphatidylserine synthase [Candidatus Clavichlamydia salmonicola]MBF5050450.1 Uncharacterized protein [Candidatus Clavichlamydia salmonicola]